MSFSASLAVNLDIPGLPDDSGPLYELLVFPMPRAQFWVHELTGREALSELYEFDVTVSTEEILDGIVERALIGQRTTLIIRAGAVPRIVRGVVSAITVVRRHPVHGRTQYRIRIVPRLWLLTLKRKSRIYQHHRVDQIVSQVLSEAGIAAHWLLEHNYPERVYCTQYEETDFEFISRLVAEAGIFFHVANPPKAALHVLAALTTLGPPPGGPLGPALSVAATIAVDAVFGAETVVFSDGTLGYSPLDDGSWLADLANMVGVPTEFTTDIGVGDLRVGLPSPKLSYLAMEGSSIAKDDKVTHFEATREVLTTSATYRDYDPRRPAALLVSTEGNAGLKDTLSGAVDAEVNIGADGISADASVDIGGTLVAAALQALSGLPDLEYYDHHGPFLFPNWEYDAAESGRILRQQRRRRHHAEGRSFVPVMHVGHRFGLEDHPLDHLNIDHAIIAVRHTGRNTTEDNRAIYENEFECVAARIPYPPARPVRESVNVVLTATVVGPHGHEIYTDDLGQIKVQFHWDRDGGRNEHSSCWLRTMQSWAGTGWGTQFIPRIGMEVIVVFEGGDPDKPEIRAEWLKESGDKLGTTNSRWRDSKGELRTSGSAFQSGMAILSVFSSLMSIRSLFESVAGDAARGEEHVVVYNFFTSALNVTSGSIGTANAVLKAIGGMEEAVKKLTTMGAKLAVVMGFYFVITSGVSFWKHYEKPNGLEMISSWLGIAGGSPRVVQRFTG